MITAAQMPPGDLFSLFFVSDAERFLRFIVDSIFIEKYWVPSGGQSSTITNLCTLTYPSQPLLIRPAKETMMMFQGFDNFDAKFQKFKSESFSL